MALINCPECGKEISDTCDVCVHCGYKIKKGNTNQPQARRRRKGWLIPVIIGAVLITIFLIAPAIIYLLWYLSSTH